MLTHPRSSHLVPLFHRLHCSSRGVSLGSGLRLESSDQLTRGGLAVVYISLMTQELVVTNKAVVSTVFAAEDITGKLLGPDAVILGMACKFPPARKDLTALWHPAMVFIVLLEMRLEMFPPLFFLIPAEMLNATNDTVISR